MRNKPFHPTLPPWIKKLARDWGRGSGSRGLNPLPQNHLKVETKGKFI
jgi:hypothetical protein